MPKSFPQIFDSFSSVMEVLRNEQFQDLLENYERAKKSFLIGYEVEDQVSSQVLFDTGGALLKPEDYLEAFSTFVRENETAIEAIAILLNKPKDWNTAVLNELRKKLREHTFNEHDLERAHKIIHHRDAVDIISMVKHAAKESEPLLSPEERVSRAMQKVTAGKQLTDEQQKWMGYIQEHLKYNMTLDETDLQELPVFTDRGGFTKFKRVFLHDYKSLIREINVAIAA